MTSTLTGSAGDGGGGGTMVGGFNRVNGKATVTGLCPLSVQTAMQDVVSGPLDKLTLDIPEDMVPTDV